MVTLDEAIIARFEKSGKHFEVLVDPELAYELKEGKTVSLSRMLAVNEVFTDARKAARATPSDVEKTFGTPDIERVAETIIRKGDVQLTTEFRRKKTEEKRKQIAAFISRNAINPQTRVPHPAERVLAAMEQAHINVDPFKPADQQVDDTVKKIKEIIPLSIEEITIIAEIPAAFSGRAYGAAKEFGIVDERWLGDGRLVVKIRIPAGLKESVFRRFNAISQGNARIEEEKK